MLCRVYIFTATYISKFRQLHITPFLAKLCFIFNVEIENEFTIFEFVNNAKAMSKYLIVMGVCLVAIIINLGVGIFLGI